MVSCIYMVSSILSIFFPFQENPDAIPSLLTLALNDIMTYDKVRQNALSCE